MKTVLVVAVALTAGCATKPVPKPVEPVTETIRTPSPEPDDDQLSISGQLGTLSDHEVGEPFQRRWSEIKQCYFDARDKEEYLSGALSLKARIGRAGEVRSMYVVASSIGNYDVERCILEVAESLNFARPHGGAEAEFTYPIQFKNAEQAPLTWEETKVTAVWKKYRRDIDACSTNAKGKTTIVVPPSLGMTIHVAPGGKVPSVGFYADAPLDPEFTACLSARAQKWKFEDPVGHVAKATVSLETLLIAETPSPRRKQVVGRR